MELFIIEKIGNDLFSNNEGWVKDADAVGGMPPRRHILLGHIHTLGYHADYKAVLMRKMLTVFW